MAIVFFCVIFALAFLLLSIIIRGITAVVEAVIAMVDVLSVLLIGAGVCIAIDILVDLFCGGFWNIILPVIIIGVIIYFGAAIFGAILSILAVVAEGLVFIAGIVYSILEWLGFMCESGLMYFLKVINNRVSVN